MDEAGDAFECGAGDVAGFLEQGDLGGGLHHADPVHEAREAVVGVERVLALEPADEAGIAGFDDDFGALVFVGIEVDVFGFAGEAVEGPGEIGEPLDVLDAGDGAGLVLGEFVAFPDGDEVGGLAEEEDLALAFVFGVGEEEEHGFLLGDAGEVEQVGIGDETAGAVGVGGRNVVGVDDGQRAGEEQLAEACPVLDEQRGINGGVTHAGKEFSQGGARVASVQWPVQAEFWADPGFIRGGSDGTRGRGRAG